MIAYLVYCFLDVYSHLLLHLFYLSLSFLLHFLQCTYKGETEYPFEFKLVPCPSGTFPGLIETYHGVYVSVRYTITVQMIGKGLFSKNLDKTLEIIVTTPDVSPLFVLLVFF